MSIWNKYCIKKINESLKEEKHVDVLIIGAGMTGLNTAYYLKDFKNIAVVEANEVGYGVTLGSTAKINYLQSGIYRKISMLRTEVVASRYLKSQKYAVGQIKEIIESENIDCSFRKVPSFIFAHDEEEVDKVKKEVTFLLSNGVDIKRKELPKNICAFDSYMVEDTYIFNPIKYLKGLKNILEKNNVSIYEKTKILKIDKCDDQYVCYTEFAKIYAKSVVVASQYPYFTMPFMLPLKSYCEKSYMIVSRVKKDGLFTCINTQNPIYSCRFYEDGNDIYQISLSESHNIAFKSNDKYHFEQVQKRFNLKNSDIVLKYSNTDIITPDGLPYIGEIKENLYVACGFNTWGMTNSVLAANIISDDILNVNNEFSKLFNPKRVNLAHIFYLPYIMFSQAKSYIGSKLVRNKDWYSSRVFNMQEKGVSYGVYFDEVGGMHKVINKCPHLGCSLIFNETEKTWDCPCHSSRFDVDGKCIKGPSNYDISVKEKSTRKE